MNLFSFLVGLAIGGSLLLIYRWRLRQRLRSILRSLPAGQASFSVSSQLTHAITVLQAQAQDFRQELKGLQRGIKRGPMGYLLVDEENQLLDGNDEALKLLNIQVDLQGYREAPPRLLLELVRSYDLDQLIEQTRARQTPTQKDWSLFPINADVLNFPAQTQEISYLSGYAFPLPHQQVAVLLESRQDANYLSQQRDRWISDVAHELKTPLTSIRLVAETLQYRVDPSLKQWVDRLLKEVIRLSTLVQEILDLSQLEANPNRGLTYQTVDVPSLIQSAWQSLAPIFADRDITLNYIGPGYLAIQADEHHLYRVLINLFDNSLRYVPDSQPITVKLELLDRTPAQIQLDVIDAGCGFAETDLPLVFERFYRGDTSRVRPQHANRQASSIDTAVQEFVQPSSGSGLGLALVRQVVDRHGGTITARNHPETSGAWIQIQLPQNPT